MREFRSLTRFRLELSFIRAPRARAIRRAYDWLINWHIVAPVVAQLISEYPRNHPRLVWSWNTIESNSCYELRIHNSLLFNATGVFGHLRWTL